MVNYLIIAIASAALALSIFYFLFKYRVDRELFAIHQHIVTLRKGVYQPTDELKKNKNLTQQITDELRDWENERKSEIDKLKNTEVYRKEFLGNVSHELKTPIFSVQGYLHTLIDGGIDDVDVNIVYLNKAAKSLDRLIAIVDDLEAISKLESGDLSLEQRTFDFNDLVLDVIDSLEIIAKEKSIELISLLGSGQQIYVFADKERVRQVLVNLLVNSIKYGKQNGKTEINISEKENVVSIEISDNGIGIEKKHLPRLFERFYRVDKHRSRDEGGTGLGLGIVKHILEAHGQRITVSSVYGKGTSFYFTLKRG